MLMLLLLYIFWRSLSGISHSANWSDIMTFNPHPSIKTSLSEFWQRFENTPIRAEKCSYGFLLLPIIWKTLTVLNIPFTEYGQFVDMLTIIYMVTKYALFMGRVSYLQILLCYIYNQSRQSIGSGGSKMSFMWGPNNMWQKTISVLWWSVMVSYIYRNI